MECTEPGAIRKEELMAYYVGDAVRPAVEQHLASCQACSSELATYQRIDRQLTAKLYRWDCPSSQILGEYQLGMLGVRQSAKTRQHLQSCVLCAAEVASLTEFLANDPFLVDRKVEVASAATVNHSQPIQEVWRTLEHLRDQSLAGTRRIIAALLPAQPRLAYQRDAASATALWPRRYAAEDVNISIQVARLPERREALQLIGFVTRSNTALQALSGVPVQLLAQSASYTQDIDELGNFVFSSITPATYTLEVQFPEGIIVIEDLPVTA